MCGIGGLLRFDSESLDSGLLDAMGQTLLHRGPDDLGYLAWTPGGRPRLGATPDTSGPTSVALVHRRLSILDLSAAGRQPMGTADGRFFVVFNGEIYNYLELRDELSAHECAFQTGTDTEVLLAAYQTWGPGCLERFVGMFAFAILDVVEGTLFAARDFFGIKPFYYRIGREMFAFASEPKALLRLPELSHNVNARVVYDYLRFGYTDGSSDTFLDEVKQLPPAHWCRVRLDAPGVVEVERYWGIDPLEHSDLSFEDAADRLRELFLESIELHLRSDVRIGSALSGGVDSSAIVMSIRRVLGRSGELHAFSYLADDPGLSEERWVDIIRQASGANIHAVRPGARDLAEDLDALVKAQDEPFATTSIYAQHRVFRAAKAAGVTVMLDGQGADELLAGYPAFLAARFASLIRQRRFSDALRFLRASRGFHRGGGRDMVLRAGGLLLPMALKRPALALIGEPVFPSWMDADWFRAHGVVPDIPWKATTRDVLKERMRHSLGVVGLPALLRYEDRNSMTFSIESRVPFLTPALASFAASLPEEYVISADGTTKAVFRRAMRGIVPDAILDRRDKIGFVTPERGWLDAGRASIARVLQGDRASEVRPLRLERLAAAWDGEPESPGFPVWRCTNLLRWAELTPARFD